MWSSHTARLSRAAGEHVVLRGPFPGAASAGPRLVPNNSATSRLRRGACCVIAAHCLVQGMSLGPGLRSPPRPALAQELVAFRPRAMIYHPPQRVRLQAALLQRMTGDAALTLVWVRRQQSRQLAGRSGVCPIVSLPDLTRWADDAAGDLTLAAAASDPRHPWRQQLQWYIIEHDIAMQVREQHAKALRVPSWFVTSAVLRMWACLPQTSATARRLEGIRAAGTTAKNFMRLFRKQWDFRWGAGDTPRSLDLPCALARAAVFLRWAAWMRAHRVASSAAVFINMDETRLSNIRSWAQGLVPPPRRACGTSWTTQRPKPACPRATLIAAICSSANLQKMLPQIWLPRSERGKIPSARKRQTYAAASWPQEVWYGTDGNITSELMRTWLKKVRSVVRRWNPEAKIVLGVDVCRSHIDKGVVTLARSLGFEVIFIPARMTFLLQPLDTHVFSQLKGCIRNGLLRRGLASPTGSWSWKEAVGVQAAAISEILSSRDWARVFGRIGLGGSMENLRPAVRDLVRSADLSPRPPTAEELQDYLAVSARTSALLLPLLVTGGRRDAPMRPPEASAVRPSSPRAAPVSAAAAAASGRAGGRATRLRPSAPVGYRLFPRERRALPGGERPAPCVIIGGASSAPRSHAMATRSMTRSRPPGASPAAKRPRPGG